MTPKEVIEDVRRLWRIGAESDTVQKLQKGLNKALQTLAYDLYASEAHFILELIQNADDNHYDIPRKDEVRGFCAVHCNGPGSVWEDSSAPSNQRAAETVAVLSLRA